MRASAVYPAFGFGDGVRHLCGAWMSEMYVEHE
jgi:hypothetical protein